MTSAGDLLWSWVVEDSTVLPEKGRWGSHVK